MVIRKQWGELMRMLSDELLLESYYKAIDLNLEENFIELLQREIENRGIIVKENNSGCIK